MLNYDKLKDRPRDFLAARGLLPEEFIKLLPASQGVYEKPYPRHLTSGGDKR